jgi:hypothetical protein
MARYAGLWTKRLDTALDMTVKARLSAFRSLTKLPDRRPCAVLGYGKLGVDVIGSRTCEVRNGQLRTLAFHLCEAVAPCIPNALIRTIVSLGDDVLGDELKYSD